jgi:hypothetical protein
MSTCVLSVRGLLILLGLGVVGWLSLFAIAAYINRKLGVRKG